MIVVDLPGGSRLEAATTGAAGGEKGSARQQECFAPTADTGNEDAAEDPGDDPRQLVWLGHRDGGVVVPVTASGPQVGHARSVEIDAMQARSLKATLDAASWLMPGLPRELIADVLGID